MTDETAGGGETAANGAANPAQGPGMQVLAQYTKDLSFENPNAPGSLRAGEQPKVDVQLDVNGRGMEEKGVFEVALRIKVESKRGDDTLFVVELVYAGLFRLANLPEEMIEPILLIECPRILYPFARQIVAQVTTDGGFPPMLLEPMDFAGLYQAQRQQAGPGAPPPAAS